ncbi:MAG TPA: hypothetical protein VGN00_15180 [Puia sp.]|jgi:hypothetical protein
MTSSPILLIVFNRPSHARAVFEKVRAARPSRLYVAVDGPREHRPEDAALVQETIGIYENIDWPCEVRRLVRKDNLGCKMAVSSAISWFFANEERGIILEDDCLPDASFFPYCDHLLEKYQATDSVMHINGVNFQDGNRRGSGTYYFSKICHVWGWASWRRAWQKYDINMNGLEEFFSQKLYLSVLNYKDSLQYWQSSFVRTKEGLIDTWDYQWVFSVWKNNGLSITPNVNLISNIGFDEMATHTHKDDPRVSNKPLTALTGEISDPLLMVPDYDGDQYSFDKLFSYKNDFVSKVKRKLYSLTNSQ